MKALPGRPWLALGLWLSLSGAVWAAAQAPPPAGQGDQRVFPGSVEQVTVDAVVLDKKGDAVLDLGREDFTVLDEGKPQEIVSFELVRPPAGAAASAAAGTTRPRVATNETTPGRRGRQFVIVFDDLHMSAVNAQRAKAAVSAFLDKGTSEGDRVLLASTSGSAWWSTLMEKGRADLAALLQHLDGRRILDNAADRLTDYEAVRIFVYRDVRVAARVQQRFDRYGNTSRQEMAQAAQAQAESGTIAVDRMDPYIDARASEAYFKLRARMEITLDVLRRCLAAMAGSRERKAVLLVSEGFVEDPSNPSLKRVVESARHANAAIYFIDTRGLVGLPQAYSAEFGAPLPEQDLMSAIADVSLEGEGAAALASDTGGFSVRNTNDLTAGAARVGRESGSYYLLGYNPGPIGRDGRFRKLEVRVRGKGLVVRARRGYFAPSDEAAAAPAGKPGTDVELQKALDSPGTLDGIPLGLTTYVLQDSGAKRARVVLAAEADLRPVAFPEVAGRAQASLDTLLVVTHRETGEVQRLDQAVQLERRAVPPAGPVWYAFMRELELPAGLHQARLIVRDATSRKMGSVILEFEVPPLDRLRVSTPILTDTLQPAREGGLVPTTQVRRVFRAGGLLYCSFDVFAAARGKDGMPHVKAGHALRRPDGVVLGNALPRLIEPTSIGALTRVIQIPLAGAAPGKYELVLTVEDEISGQTREVVEPFTVAPAAAAAAR